MSMENAILELASGMKELAAAVREARGGWAPVVPANEGTQRIKGVMSEAEQDPIDARAAELAQATEKRAEAAIKAQQKDAAANLVTDTGESKSPEGQITPVKPDAELEAAVTKVEEAAQAEAAPLDYHKDVKPVLLDLVKAKTKPVLVELLAKYNAKNGEQIKADDFAAIVADANALIAA